MLPCRQPFHIQRPEGTITWALCAPPQSQLPQRPGPACLALGCCQLPEHACTCPRAVAGCLPSWHTAAALQPPTRGPVGLTACCVPRRNSEIYNHEAIKATGALQGVRIVKDSKSDSAIIGHLYEKLVRLTLMEMHACVVPLLVAEPAAAAAALQGMHQLASPPALLLLMACRTATALPSGPVSCPPSWPCSGRLPGRAAVQGDSNELWGMLDGVFACVLFDEASGEFTAARDPLGVCPLYWGCGADGSRWFASEMKALQACCTSFEIFPPVRLLSAPRSAGARLGPACSPSCWSGRQLTADWAAGPGSALQSWAHARCRLMGPPVQGHCYRSRTDQLERYYSPQWLDPERIPRAEVDYGAIRVRQPLAAGLPALAPAA